MIQIRRSCFETNSSSTHAICIPKEHEIGGGIVIYFCLDEFGWRPDQVDANDYLYTAICEIYGSDEEKFNKILKHIVDVCKTKDIKCVFEQPIWQQSTWSPNDRYLDDAYIDHAGELKELLDKLLSDDEMLLRYISGATVFTGNDNSDSDRIDEIITDYENDGYYVYEKGN